MKLFELTSEGDFENQPVDINEFIQVNEFEHEEIAEIESLDVDQTLFYGGGASPIFILKRVQ